MTETPFPPLQTLLPADLTAGSLFMEASGLGTGYAGRRVGRDLSLSLHVGEILCLLGPNGSGKSTLFRTLLGLLPRLEGEIRLRGRELGQYGRRELASLVAYVPQAVGGVFPFSVEEVVLMGRAARLGLFATPGKQDRQIAHACLDRLGILALVRQPFTEISGGERQLALIARALAQQAACLFMDEPTASLDFGNQQRVLAQIAGLRDAGMTVLLCTHQPEHALRLADRVILLDRGGIVCCDTPVRTMTAERLASLYELTPEEVRRALPQLAG